MRKTCIHLGLVASLFLLGGCATTSKGDMIENTNDKVDQLVTKIGPAVENLNQTTTELTAKVDTTDQNTRKLQSNIEEMQAQLEGMKKDVKTIQKVVYQQNNLTPAGSSGVVIEPPAGAAAPEGAAPAASAAPTGDADAPALEPMTTAAPAPVQTAAAAPAPTPAPTTVTAGPGAKELYQQAQQRYASDDFKAAITLFDDYLAKYPGDEAAANAQFWKAKSQLRLGQYDDSVAEFMKVTKTYPNSTKVPFALHNAAVAYNKMGRNDEAAKLLQQVIDKYPISPAADQARQDLKKIQGQ